MCVTNGTTERQRTIDNCGLAPIVPTSDLPTDIVKCNECREEFERSDINEESDCCEECTSDNYSTCEECDELTHDNDIRCGEGSNSNTYYCEECFHDNHSTCCSCSDSVAHDDDRCSDAGDTYCESCYNDNFFWCEGCSNETSNDDMISRDCGCYCSDCAPCGDGDDFDQTRNWTGTFDFDKIGSSRKFGVELESYDSSDYHEWIGDTGWGAKEDGSISGKEFVSPPMWGNDGYDNVMNFCNLASYDGVNADDDCGFHLHIDLSDTCAEDRKGIALAYHYTREVWADFIKPERRDTYYAAYSYGSRHGYDNAWDEASILDGDDYPKGCNRYLWLNWNSYSKFNTVEVRSHEPTFDGESVINWIKAHTIFVDYVKELSVGEITRIFGNSDKTELIDTLRRILPTDVADHYIGKMHLSDMEAA